MHASTGSATAGDAPRTAHRGLRLQVSEGLAARALVEAWDELAVATDAVPWARPGWFIPWSRWMGRGSPIVFSLRSPGNEVVAVMPLQRSRSGLSSLTNWHTPAYTVVAREPSDAEALLRRVVGRCGGRLTLDFVPAPLADLLEHVAGGCGARSHRRVLEHAPYIALQDGWTAHVDKHLLSDLHRRARRLGERGTVGFDVVDGTEGLEGSLHEGLLVEASGWKGRAGTAIVSSPSTHGFYRDVSRWLADQGLLRLAFLRVDGMAAAFDLGVEHGGAHYLLKTGYDEQLRTYAPGKQLRLRMIEACTARGLTTYELLGDQLSWKRAWTPLRREFLQVHAFPHGLDGSREWIVHAKALPAARTARDGLRRLGSRTARRDGSRKPG